MIAVLFSLMLNLSLATTPQAPVDNATNPTTKQPSPTEAVCGGVLTWNENDQ